MNFSCYKKNKTQVNMANGGCPHVSINVSFKRKERFKHEVIQSCVLTALLRLGVCFKFSVNVYSEHFITFRGSTAKLNNFSRLEPTLHLLGVQFDQNVAQSIITEKPGAATKLLYQLYIALQKKKKTGLTGLEIQTMQPQTNQRLQALKSEAFREVGT